MPSGRWARGTGFHDEVLPAQRPGTRPSPWICVPPTVRPKPRSNKRAASHAVPVAVLCCCTVGPAVRIMFLTSGAKGTRTPDPLLANSRQHVHTRPSPQVIVPQRPSVSLWIRPCCGTSVLYFSGRSPASVPVAVLGSRSGQHRPRRNIRALRQQYPCSTSVMPGAGGDGSRCTGLHRARPRLPAADPWRSAGRSREPEPGSRLERMG
jgi:hypothetical protein